MCGGRKRREREGVAHHNFHTSSGPPTNAANGSAAHMNPYFSGASTNGCVMNTWRRSLNNNSALDRFRSPTRSTAAYCRRSRKNNRYRVSVRQRQGERGKCAWCRRRINKVTVGRNSRHCSHSWIGSSRSERHGQAPELYSRWPARWPPVLNPPLCSTSRLFYSIVYVWGSKSNHAPAGERTHIQGMHNIAHIQYSDYSYQHTIYKKKRKRKGKNRQLTRHWSIHPIVQYNVDRVPLILWCPAPCLLDRVQNRNRLQK